MKLVKETNTVTKCTFVLSTDAAFHMSGLTENEIKELEAIFSAPDRVEQLETMIRDVAIPALKESMRLNDCEPTAMCSLYDLQDDALTKLREAIK